MMKSKKFIFKLASILCLIFVYLAVLAGVFALVEHISFIWKPESAFTKSFGKFEPIFAYINLNFYEQPVLYMDKSFITLSLISTVSLLLTGILFFWFLHKLLKNIYTYSLFMYENVSIITKLGLTSIILGSISTYMDNLLVSRALTALDISNASISYADFSYIETIISGVVLILIASALKTAVHAVEENKKTI